MNSNNKISKYEAKIVKEKIKKWILLKDHNTQRTLTYYFLTKNKKNFDKNELGHRKINKEDFIFGLKNLNIILNNNDQHNYFSYYDQYNEGYIDFDLFLSEIRVF